MLVASSNPLDQFLVAHPEYLLSRPVESGLINPDNVYVLASHVKCGAFELPFGLEGKLGRQPVTDLLEHLESHEVLHQAGDQWHWNSAAFPAEEVSLRSASTENVVIVDETDSTKPRVIGEMDRLGAATMLHDEAIYIHEGQQHEVVRLDWEEKKAYVRRVNVDYYTDADLAVRLSVLEVDEEEAANGARRAYGDVALTTLSTIYKKIKLHTHENVGWGKIRLPEDNLHTKAYWLTLPPAATAQLSPTEIQEGLLGLRHVLANVAPLYLMCDPRDLGVQAEIRAPFTEAPTVFVYDNVPGGIGFAERLFALHGELLAAGDELIRGCQCESGCPSCVGVPTEPRLNGKALTLGFLRGLRA